MLSINWEEYKEYKQHTHKRADNFITLLDFMKSYYNVGNSFDMYNVLQNDELAKMMLDKRDIRDAEALESFVFNLNG